MYIIIGKLILCNLQYSKITIIVLYPSTTPLDSFIIYSALYPFAIWTPNDLFRLNSPIDVRIISPMPASPNIVLSFPPYNYEKYWTSTVALEIKAVLVLNP